jgi:hypothetical protein
LIPGLLIPPALTDWGETINSLLRRIVLFHSQGHIQPIWPLKVFPAADVSEPIRYMQRGKHMGKIAVAMPSSTPTPQEKMPFEASTRELRLRGNDESAYLFVGGLGGLGRSITIWMVERGARHFVFLSRSAASMSQDDPFLVELRSCSCTVTLVSGDVSVYEDVVRAVEAAGRPIAGVLQASMVLRVCFFSVSLSHTLFFHRNELR